MPARSPPPPPPSGRPKFEADLALKRFRLLPFFESIVTLEDCKEEEKRLFRSTGKKIKCSKPHPYSLLRVVQKIGMPHPRCAYVGYIVDDMWAARAAKKSLAMLAIGFFSGGNKQKALKESLLRAGADYVIENPEELLQFVS